MTLPSREPLTVERLGEALDASPLRGLERFVDEADRVLVSPWANEVSAALQRGEGTGVQDVAIAREAPAMSRPARIVTCERESPPLTKPAQAIGD